ncbi:MAG: hypothetical protein P1U61_03640 [Legionellaceae bacterium]|nr:hypothetical protein [Legionellaceae bacterium]
MPYVGKAEPKLYQPIDISDQLPEHEKKLLDALVAYRAAWAGVKQKKSFWDKTKDKNYFETTVLDYLSHVSRQEKLKMSPNEIKKYLIKQGFFSEFQHDEALKLYIKKMSRTTYQPLLDFYFFRQKIPEFIDALQKAALESEAELVVKQAEIKAVVGKKTYLLNAIPEAYIDHDEHLEQLKLQQLIADTPHFWLTHKPVSEIEVKKMAPLMSPNDLVRIVNLRQKKGLPALPLLENVAYINSFSDRLNITGIRNDMFRKDYLGVLKTAEKYLLNGGKLTFKLQCLFENDDWFSAMQQYKTSYEKPLENISDLGIELLNALQALYQLLFNVLSILTTATIALTIEMLLVSSLIMFFQPHNFWMTLTYSAILPGGIFIIPVVVIGTLGAMLATASAATGFISSLLSETHELSNDMIESFSRLGHRVYLSLAVLFNQGVLGVSSTVPSEEPPLDKKVVEDERNPYSPEV